MNSLRHKIVLVTRATRLEELVQRYNTIEQARFYVEHLGSDFGDYLREHEAYVKARSETTSSLEEFGFVQPLERALLPNFIFAGTDLVVVLGQDGTVANTLKYLDRQPVVGVNPDSRRWDGILVPFSPAEVPRIVPAVLKGMCELRRITMARVDLDDGQVLHGVNDIFVGPRSHTSARYRLRWGGREEDQSSSGVIVSTGLGSTGWLRSLFTGALALAHASGWSGKSPVPETMPWDSESLRFTVREPFPSRTSSTSIVCGEIRRGETIQVASQMGDGGVIFSDGVERDFLEFRSGMTARIGLAAREGRLVARPAE